VELRCPGREGEEVNEWSSVTVLGDFLGCRRRFLFEVLRSRQYFFLVISRPFLQDPSANADAEIVLLVTGANVSPEVLRRATAYPFDARYRVEALRGEE